MLPHFHPKTETLDFDGEQILREFCPIDGRYRATYNVHDVEDGDATVTASLAGISVECAGGESQLDTCPSGSALNLRFRKCSFGDQGEFETTEWLR